MDLKLICDPTMTSMVGIYINYTGCKSSTPYSLQKKKKNWIPIILSYYKEFETYLPKKLLCARYFPPRIYVQLML